MQQHNVPAYMTQIHRTQHVSMPMHLLTDGGIAGKNVGILKHCQVRRCVRRNLQYTTPLGKPCTILVVFSTAACKTIQPCQKQTTKRARTRRSAIAEKMPCQIRVWVCIQSPSPGQSTSLCQCPGQSKVSLGRDISPCLSPGRSPSLDLSPCLDPSPNLAQIQSDSESETDEWRGRKCYKLVITLTVTQH